MAGDPPLRDPRTAGLEGICLRFLGWVSTSGQHSSAAPESQDRAGAGKFTAVLREAGTGHTRHLGGHAASSTPQACSAGFSFRGSRPQGPTVALGTAAPFLFVRLALGEDDRCLLGAE